MLPKPGSSLTSPARLPLHSRLDELEEEFAKGTEGRSRLAGTVHELEVKFSGFLPALHARQAISPSVAGAGPKTVSSHWPPPLPHR